MASTSLIVLGGKQGVFNYPAFYFFNAFHFAKIISFVLWQPVFQII